MSNKPNYGVLVARCQVDELHEGHMNLFREIKARHNRVLLFLGCKTIGSTHKNPLDFETRKAMVQARFPEFFVLPLMDTMTDEQWSKNLDAKIREIVDYGEVTLYGGRDCFAPRYSGHYKPVELVLPQNPANGTDIRNRITNTVMESAEFRAGVIYAMTNLRPSVKPTVDIVITHTHPATKNGQPQEISFLLGRKAGEPAWRFIGGHAEPNSPNFEDDARREAYEETGLDIGELKYIGSAKIPDWRWADEPDQIKTLIFTAESMTMGGRGADDIAEVKWFKGSALNDGFFVKTHQVIFGVVKKHFKLEEKVSEAAV